MKSVMLCALMMLSAQVLAEETIGEKAQAAANNAGRAIKKGVNRVKEMACTEGDLKCAAKKAGNRIEESADAVKDKAEEVKNKID